VIDFLAAKIRLTAPKWLETQKLTLNLKDQVLTCGILVHSHSSKSRTTKDARQTERQEQSTSTSARMGCLLLTDL